MKRTGKFYRKNEAEVMRALGLKETKGSGCGWIEKEDGQNEDVICQLKSTDANSIKVNKLDLDKLVYNAGVSNKIPLFAIQFLNSNEVWLMTRPEYLEDVSKYIQTGKKPCSALGLDIDESVCENINMQEVSKIKSSSNKRKMFMQEHDKKFKKERRSAK